MGNTSELLLSLFIINLGIAFGAGMYEAKIILSQWFTKSAESSYSVNIEAMNKLDSGRKFWGFVTTIPLTLLTIANLILAWDSPEPRYQWWIASAVITLIERITTFSYFIPTIIRLQRANSLSPKKVSTSVAMWIRVNYLRNVLTLIAMIFALRAFWLHSN
jgi:hypothetical protein